MARKQSESRQRRSRSHTTAGRAPQGPHFPAAGARNASAAEPEWAGLSDEALLDLRISDLQLDFEQSPMVEFRDQLHEELRQRGLRVKPHCWFSDDWFSPDDVPGIAVPFYMAHRRLIRLERNQMREVEGGTKEWCMRIMRHEAGHAIDTAFGLYRRKGYKEVFGNYRAPYPESYRPRPRSKKYVLHLEPWYAQSHPAEDFAETFAVWLKPGRTWQQKYQGWPALKKLEFVDGLMASLQGKPARVKSKSRIDPTHRLKHTLREHYAERQSRYSIEGPSVFDDDLRKLFSDTPGSQGARTAAAFLQKHRSQLCRSISQWTGEHRYTLHQVIREMIERCRHLNLYVDREPQPLLQDLQVMLTVHTMNYLHAGHRVAL